MSDQVSVEKELICLHGEMIFTTVMGLKSEVLQHLQERDNAVIDFSAVSRCDSSAISLLLAWLRFAKETKRTLTFQNLPDTLVAIAKLCGVIDFLPIRQST